MNYLIKTPGRNIYHSGDSHYSIYLAKHGKDHIINVALGLFGINYVGIASSRSKLTAGRNPSA